jgi:hypothetical protein
VIARSLFVAAALSTIFCTAVNCYTYRLAYPLWSFVGKAEFRTLHREYLRLLSPVITFPHIVMFFASAGLLWQRPASLSLAAAAALFVLDAGVVVVSAFWAGPIHSRFERTGTADENGLRTLIQISLLRSGMMLAASSIVAAAVWRAVAV